MSPLKRGAIGDVEGEERMAGELTQRVQLEVLLIRVANRNSTLLFTGESGVGKEVAAHFVHESSSRAKEPFIAVNCAAIPGELIESQLFGHEKGAFTNAHQRHHGYLERA